MDISVLKKDLLDKKLKSFYVFTGEELALQDIYINKIAEISNLQIIRADALQDIYTKLISKSLFAEKPKIYVIRNDEIYFKT